MKNHSVHARRLGRGFSLIELMVSLTIGLVISVAAISAYLGAASATKVSDAQSRMNEDAQAALTLLSQQLRMARNNPKRANRIDSSTATRSSLRNPVYLPTPTYSSFSVSPSSFALSDFFLRGCEGKFSNITTAANLDALTCSGGTSTLPDSLAISYEADANNTIATSAGVPTDCLGNALTTITASNVPVINSSGTGTTTSSVNFWVADNRYYVGTSTTIVTPSLYCKGNGGNSTAQPLVENIEDLQITYGSLNPATTATTIAGYLTADGVVSDSNMLTLPTEADRWFQVVTARICVLVRSDNPVLDNIESAKYRNCEGVVVDAPDKRLRKAYFTSVGIRN